MESTVGVVETVTTKDGRNANGPWTLTSAKIGGQWFKTFDRDLGLQLKSMEGDTVELEYTVKVSRNPEYSDDLIAQKVKKSESAQNTTPDPAIQARTYTSTYNQTKDENIRAQCALKAAASAIPFEQYESLEEYVKDVGLVAETFHNWLQTATGGSVSPTQGEIDLVVKETQSSLPGTF